MSNTDAITIGITGGALSSTPNATPGTNCAGAAVQLSAGAGGGSVLILTVGHQIRQDLLRLAANPTVTPAVNTSYFVAVNDGFSTVNSIVSVTVNAVTCSADYNGGRPDDILHRRECELNLKYWHNLPFVYRSHYPEHKYYYIRKLYCKGNKFSRMPFAIIFTGQHTCSTGNPDSTNSWSGHSAFFICIDWKCCFKWVAGNGLWTLTRNDGITLQGSGTSQTVSGLAPGIYTLLLPVPQGVHRYRQQI